MVAILLIAAVLAIALLVLVAVFSKNPSVVEAQHAERRLVRLGARPMDRIPPAELRSLVMDLLQAMGLEVVRDGAPGASEAAQRLLAVQTGPFRDAPHVIFVEAAPPGDLVQGSTVLELAEQVKAEAGAVGLLITPYAIDRAGIAGLDPSVELVDGMRLRELVARHLPHRLPELENYRLGRLEAVEPPRRVVREPLAAGR